jgi:hypothetical protein
MSDDFVFLGPSLPTEEAAALLPGAAILPPIEHGDLLRLDPAPGDRVLIIDGLFMMRAPVRHREILYLLDRGVIVAGSSSMGALRAAELWPYGMRGVGTIFELFRSGTVTDDDEVAVVHGPADEGHRTLSEPLVNLRVALTGAVAGGVLTRAEADRLLEIGRALPFRARGIRALQRAARSTAARSTAAGSTLDDDSIDRFIAWNQAHPLDAKAEDARLLLRLAAAGSPELRPRDLADTPIEHVDTYLMEAWQARSGGRKVNGRFVGDALPVAAIMAFHPDFPALHQERILAGLVSAPDGTPAERVRRQALALARDRGLLPDGDEAAIYEMPALIPAERALPATEAALRVLVRLFGANDCRTLAVRTLPPALRRPEVLAEARSFVQSALRLTDRLPHPYPHRLWGCPPEELIAACWDHGFEDLVRLREVVEPFLAWLKICGPPTFPTASRNIAPPSASAPSDPRRGVDLVPAG